jgi:hypothetical protein
MSVFIIGSPKRAHETEWLNMQPSTIVASSGLKQDTYGFFRPVYNDHLYLACSRYS